MPVSFEIFPSIGISRVGTSSKFFVGPEPNVPLDLVRRDANGGLLRQAARFRIYECDRDANGVLQNAREIPLPEARIEWAVHLVNRKAAALRFNGGRPTTKRRNKATGDDSQDRHLIIDPGIKQISNPGEVVQFDGVFGALPVSLGSAFMQSDGRLCVIGGNGTSGGSGKIRNFADNDGWHDDMGDGPVTASITRGGQTITAKPAWVVVAPPDFAPEISNVVTMYDVLFDRAVARGIFPEPPIIFYDRMVRPILERARNMQWVNRQARLGYDDTLSGGHGPDGGRGNFDFGALGDKTTPAAARLEVFRLLRDPAEETGPAGVSRRKHMPRLNDDNDTGEVLPLTRQQYRALKLWAQGQFETTDPAPPPESEPDAVTRVALQACAGAGLFPGIEMGRIVWEPRIYFPDEAFRFSPEVVRPGEITGRNAVPWQADFWQCRWEENENLNEQGLGWWPAQRPDDVLKSAAMDPVPWTRGLEEKNDVLVANWHRLGFVKQDPANPGVFLEQDRDPTLPP